MIDLISAKLFYPMLFTTITIITIAIAIIIGLVKAKTKDNGLFNNIFNRHSDEHEDITDKMKSMHDNVIHVEFSEKHEKEFHSLECNIKELQKNLKELKQQVDLLVERVIKLENKL